MDIVKHYSHEAWTASKAALQLSKHEVQRLATKENLIIAAKALLAAYGLYVSARVVYKSAKEIVNLVATVIWSRKVSKRNLSDVFVENRRQWAVVTGATSGIGLELAKILNLCNFNLILIGRDEQKLREVCGSLTGDLRPNQTKYVVIDFATCPVDQIFARLDQCLQEHRVEEIKLLVNSVGAAECSPFAQQSFGQVIEELNTNYRSHLAMTFYFENKVKKSRIGEHCGMIFVGSLLGTYPLPAFRSYSYCKHLVHGLGLYVGRAHGVYFDTLVAPVGSVHSKPSDLLRAEQAGRAEAQAQVRKAGFGFISAQECALHLLLSFGFRSWSAGHPIHDLDRIYFPYYAAFYRSRLLALASKMRRQLGMDARAAAEREAERRADEAAAREA